MRRVQLVSLLPLKLLVQHACYSRSAPSLSPKQRGIELTQDIVPELRELQAHLAELVLCLGAQRVAPGGPEVHHRPADGGVVLLGVRIDVAGVGDLALRRRVHAVDLRRGEGFQAGQAERLGERVHARVLQ